MNSVVILSLVLIVAGLAMCWLRSAVQGTLSVIVYWAGIILVILGLILLLAPVIIYVRNQLVAAFGL